MNNENLPAEDNNIVTAEKTKKEKNRYRFPFGYFAIILIICIMASSLSGAGGSLIMLHFVNSVIVSSEEDKTKQEFLIEENTESVSSFAGEETLTQEEATQEKETFLPSESHTSEAVTEPQVTEAIPLTKGEIYSDAVNSIYAIKSSWKQYYDSLFGSYYRPASSTGTGFSISDNGYIVTNYHVIEKAETLTVTDFNGDEYKASVVGSEPSNDVAIIKIDAKTVPVDLGSSSSLKVGDDIMVIGNALGELSYTFTDGIVSHLSRNVTLESGETINMFQTNAAINNGNSGGPVYNMDGKVIGIASAKYYSESIEGLGFCIPVDDVKTMLADIILYGYVTGKPSLGVSLQTVSSSMASRYSLPQGCYIVAIDSDSELAENGIKQGDVITKVGGKTVSSCDELKEILSKKAAGDPLSITCMSSGEKKTVSIHLGEYKPSEPRTDYSNVYDF